MQSDFLEKWYIINEWFKDNHIKVYGEDFYKQREFKINSFSIAADEEAIDYIESLLSEKIPNELKVILKTYNGEIGQGNSPFFEQRLLSTKEIKEQIEFGLSLKKPVERHIKNNEVSNELISQIVNEVKSKLKLSNWFKITFQSGDLGFRMPTIYRDELNLEDKENVSIDHSKAFSLTKLLQQEEKETYNWDDIDFTFYNDGRIQTKRTDTDWNYGITSFPDQTVKALYFHYKWIPIFSDNGGNYIGIDLDPNLKGSKGQVIIYGRDTYQNTTIASSLDDLFDIIIADIKKETQSILVKDQEYHLHERLKRLASYFCA